MSSASATMQLENSVAALHRSFTESGFALNSDKSEAVLFSTAQHVKWLSGISNVDTAGSIIAQVNKRKLLDVMLDGNKFKWPS